MRKVVFLNFPTHGCINPLLATASELVNRSEKIIYYCTEEFRNKIEQTGAEFRPYQGLVNEFQIDNFNLYKALKLNLEMTVDKLDHNLDIIRKEKPDYIIHDSLCTWGKHIASLLDIPAVNLMHSFPVTNSSITYNSDTAALLLNVGIYKLKNKLTRNNPQKLLKEKYDIDLSLGDILVNKEKLNIVYTSQHMEPNIFEKSKSYKFVGPSLFFKNEKTDFPFEKLKNKKVIYISLGTLLRDNSNIFNNCIEAFLNTDFFVVISTGLEKELEKFKELPDNFMVRQYVPQQQVLEYVDVFITHAGMNSVNESLCFGVPMILLPHTYEQILIADRVEELGLGISKKIIKISSKQLIEITNLLIADPNYKKQAEKYKNIFGKEENKSHIKAANEILSYIDNQL